MAVTSDAILEDLFKAIHRKDDDDDTSDSEDDTKKPKKSSTAIRWREPRHPATISINIDKSLVYRKVSIVTLRLLDPLDAQCDLVEVEGGDGGGPRLFDGVVVVIRGVGGIVVCVVVGGDSHGE